MATPASDKPHESIKGGANDNDAWKMFWHGRPAGEFVSTPPRRAPPCARSSGARRYRRTATPAAVRWAYAASQWYWQSLRTPVRDKLIKHTLTQIMVESHCTRRRSPLRPCRGSGAQARSLPLQNSCGREGQTKNKDRREGQTKNKERRERRGACEACQRYWQHLRTTIGIDE